MSGMARCTLNLLRGLKRAHAASPLILWASSPSALPAEVRSSAALENMLKDRCEPAPSFPIRTRDGFEFQLVSRR